MITAAVKTIRPAPSGPARAEHSSMRILVLSDVHANLVALEAVLNAAAGEWDQLWFLGDLVGYGPQPDECISLLRDHGALCLSGNHDWAVLEKLDMADFNADARQAVEWTRSQLSPDNRAFLDSLPPRREENGVTMAHASPRHPVWEYVLDMDTALENFEHFETPLCLIGHSHVPLVFHLDQAALELSGFVGLHGDEVKLESGRRILNPGSVGQPRDGDPRAAYAFLDAKANTWTWQRVAYDIAETQRLMRDRNLSARLIERLEVGM